ncbi:hypothetical protein F7725_028405 [Dissostichus mawsoni]|uniref:Reversion-inducing cysteine-rich protein with Kazal motifs n=1 Tax=Dissostichus mawsoni TaxID=36200 RepID=A0A7J5XGU1_DISMA|nr:hypothetical protein F7725_028405 [Dissostichus mawsoni]
MEEVVHPCNPNPCPSSHLCQLWSQRRLENCEETPCEETMRSCSTAGGQRSHGSSFSKNCRSCFCFSGETICSKKPCLTPHSSEDERRLFTGLPCSCPHHFVPVCASNGRTYPSACVARCLGFSDQNFQFGRCRLSDPCRGNTPACDTDGLVHSSTCRLLQAGKTLAYLGPCQGSCHAVGPVSEGAPETACSGVPCPPLSPCTAPPSPPQILLNQEQINTFAKVLTTGGSYTSRQPLSQS